MKYIISIILLAFYISFSDSACPSDERKPVSNLDQSRLNGRWYTYKSYAEGHADCIWHEVFNHPTKEETSVWSINIISKNGKNISGGVSIGAEFKLNDPSTSDGILSVALESGAVAVKYIVAIDYDEFSFSFSCVDGQEYLVVYLRSLFPSTETVDKIDKIIEEQGLDTTKIFTSCVGFHASDIVT